MKALLSEADYHIVFAPPPEDAYLEYGFVTEFFRDILLMDFDSIAFVSEQSSVLDFGMFDSKTQVLERIKARYGVDCSDIPNLNLWQVLHRIDDAQAAKPKP
jgi:hypothetical protein